MKTHLPQVATIGEITQNGKVRVSADVERYLKRDGKSLHWGIGSEVTISTTGAKPSAKVERKGRFLSLPTAVMEALGVRGGDSVAIVYAGGRLSLKRFSLVEKLGAATAITDRETPLEIVRLVETSPIPEKLMPMLQKEHQGKKLKVDPRKFLAGRRSLHAWMGRGLLGAADADDDALQDELIQERLASQADNGSWEDDTIQTARHIRELVDLKLTKRHKAVSAGAEWLLARAESEANPGMFFLSDRLVAKQAEILEQRRLIRAGEAQGSLGKLRFRSIVASEAKRLATGDDLIDYVCAPRLMWPNALVLEALLSAGYERHPRVQRAIQSLLNGYTYWCECNYQLGTGTHSNRPVPGSKELAQREAECIERFRRPRADGEPPYESAARVSRRTAKGANVYSLRLNDHIQTCEVITTRSLYRARNAALRRAAQAHLWLFAGARHAVDSVLLLDVFARYDHPASHVAILRSIPWLIANQNRDGSWGDGDKKDAATLAVLRALLRVGHLLPKAFSPCLSPSRSAKRKGN